MPRLKCGYCNSEGLMKVFRRDCPIPVPSGAKDLKLTYVEEGIMWQCSKCDSCLSSPAFADPRSEYRGQITQSAYGTARCRCGIQALLPEYAEELPNSPVLVYGDGDSLSYSWASCTNCLPCYICEKPLKNAYTKFKHYDSEPHNIKTFTLMHSHCAEAGGAKLENLKNIEARNIEYYNRRGQNLCVKCGRAFSFFNREGAYNAHKRCNK